MSDRRHLLMASALLVVLALGLLFTGLSTQPFEVYDEGLYGMYARTALHFDTWLHVVNTAGAYPTGVVKFSKPPLSVWAVAGSMHAFGPSLWSLRLPFALASLCTALLALAFGRLLAPGPKGTWLGALWGVFFVLSQGTTAYGRTATIEALLVVFVMLALYAHARALQTAHASSYGWAALSGAAIGGAFMTKQLVCALAIAPIGVIELMRLRSEPRASLLRMGACFTLPALGVGAWAYMLYAKVGDAALDVLWKHAIVRRVSGFDGTHHQNYLNRVATLLDQDALPMLWPLCLLGLVLMVVAHRSEAPARRDAGLLMIGSGICAWLAFDVGSRAILPWYAYSLVPVLALGQAWLVVHALEALLVRWPDEPAAQLTASAGLVSMVLAVAAASRQLVPALLAVTLAGFCVALALSLRVAIQRKRILLAGAGAWLGLLVVGTLARAEYEATEPQPYAVLGQALYQRGAKRISLDSRSQLHAYAKTTFFGVEVSSGAEPWNGGNKKGKADARVQIEALPAELKPRAGVQLLRSAGVYAVLGDLSTPPFPSDAIAKLLDSGPLTFEAEHLTTGRADTLVHDAGASGGALRRAAPWFRERAETFGLIRGTTPQLPKGRYTAKFWSALDCSRYEGAQLGQVLLTARGRKLTRNLRCTEGAESAPSIPFELTTPSSVDLSLQITQGAVTLDRITIARAAAQPRASTGTPSAPSAPRSADP